MQRLFLPAVATPMLALATLLTTLSDLPAAANELPIRKIVLYKHGVGYFERRGSVDGQQGVELHFQKDQMNDLLKSLTVLDLAGDPIEAIVYDSTKTVEQLLADYNFDLRRDDGLPGLLGQLQGHRIAVTLGSRQLQGRIVNVEERPRIDDDIAEPVYWLTLAEDGGLVRSFRTDEIASLEVLDRRLQQDMQRYLDILAQQQRRDEKTVHIAPAASGARDLLVSYVAETAVWKATYRIVLPEDDNQQPFLQGWAIVDNVSEEDWDKVDLALVSGLPVSFVQNLYDPIFKDRPVIAVEQEGAVAPRLAEAAGTFGFGGGADNRRAAGRVAKALNEQEDMKLAYDAAAEAPAPAAMPAPVDLGRQMRQLQARTVTAELGDLFEYRIAEPVSIDRNRSALLPIVAADVTGPQVYLYNEATRRENPMAALHLDNTTGLTLEGGPVTVFRGSSYMGEALLPTLTPDQKRYLTYAVDLGLRARTDRDSDSEPVNFVSINRGVMRLRRAILETRTYRFENSDDRTKRVVVEHPHDPDRRLLEPAEPLETTDNYLRFALEVPAGADAALTVREIRDIWESLRVEQLTPDQIEVFIQRKYFTSRNQDQLQRIAAAKAELVDSERQLEQLRQDRENIFNDQQRLRENLSRLGRSTDEESLRSRYISQLNQQEDRLAEMESRAQQLQQQREQLQKRLADLIENLAQDLELK